MPKKRQVTAVILTVVILLVAYPYYKFMVNFWGNYEQKKATENFMDALQEPFRKDTYGGKTPEETWAMYVEAIKKRDIDLASKYVDVNHQAEKKKYLQKGMVSGKWDLYVIDITLNPLVKKNNLEDFVMANKERGYYYYEYKLESKSEPIKVDVNFYFNPLTKVWKILY
ncbi:MAG: hypothetical protein Q7K39_00865 [Candidatus Magasanikbacteria bacterium]|nr:hypothetical protein [Candidatus Magasanikbacteria bacterium]